MGLLLLIAAGLLAGNGLGKLVAYRPRKAAPVKPNFTAAQIEALSRAALEFHA